MTDAAAFPVRGVIEGFYGKPWTQAERLDMLHFMAQHGFNAYFYAPKDDPYLRERWQEPHPDGQFAHVVQLAHAARELRLAFYYCVSPGLDMRYGRTEDFERLAGKYRRAYEAGVRHFGLFFDDIPQTLLHEEDRERYDDLAEAHADVALRLWRRLGEWSDACRLVICPTQYHGLGNEPYIRRLAGRLPQEIEIFWTGRFVCSPYLTEGDAAKFAQWTGHHPLFWDNYPVNDLGMANELHIGPLLNRDPALWRHASGYVANAMELAESSKIALYTTAAYLKAPESYDPERAWQQAVAEVAGTTDAPLFLRFADNVRSSFLNEQESPRLMEALLQFRFQFERGDQRQAVLALQAVFDQMEETAAYLLTRMQNGKLAAEVRGWVEKYRCWAKVGQSAAAMIGEAIQGRTAQAVFHLLRLKQWRRRAERLPQKVCGHVMKLFVDAVLAKATRRR
ncbi:beta-N-acetylglucosaminidase [Brevibacillus sp. SYP-B805]|uniref:beta-N-acetylglucosaminidase domain-containing protein n=1 Tax=Brevibacillus sp. SYP-B805 TaxID=1578199 RepID=UPI0013EA7B61|nr:beta-N-acetylglucosaminidase [Brevibacillus sp. SYP-B805]